MKTPSIKREDLKLKLFWWLPFCAGCSLTGTLYLLFVPTGIITINYGDPLAAIRSFLFTAGLTLVSYHLHKHYVKF